MKKSIASGAKRGSVGTLILEALSSGDKYGWEIMKAIEEKSGGEYILKEPSLYSSLKRMEVSGLITSYWQDSDIGGRRHYYNLTEAGVQKLNKSSIEWNDEKQFVNELFTQDKTENSNVSSVDSSINSLTKSINEVQKTVHKLQQNEKNINRFIVQTEKDEKTKAATPIVEQPIKAGDKLILPTINPMQQDIFSSFSNAANQEEKLELKEEPQEKTVPEVVEDKEQIEQKSVESKTEEEKVAYIASTNKADHAIKMVETPIKAEKYTSTKNTYVQMPMFENEKPTTISGIYIENEQKIKEPAPSKPTIQYLKNLATEKEFLDIKNAFKNKHKSFLNKNVEYNKSFFNKTEKSGSPSIYGSFNLNDNEVYEKKSAFNNLGLEETLKAKQKIKEDETKKEQEAEETKNLDDNKSTLTSFVKVQEAQTQKEPIDDIDLKDILGELLTESGDESKEQHLSIKDLPRINVSDNVNVTLKSKSKKEKTEQEPVYTSPVYTYKSSKQPTTNETDLYEENENLAINNKHKLKNFHENLSNDEYSSSLLEDIYFENLMVRTHKTQQKAPLMTTSYVSINKLNLNLSFTLFMLMVIQILATYIGLTNAGYYANAVGHQHLLFFVMFGVLSIVPAIIYLVVYIVAPLRKKEVNYNLLNKLGNNFIIMLIALVFIYAVNLFAGMNTLNRNDFIPTLILPAILTINLLILPIIKFILLKRKKYYL